MKIIDTDADIAEGAAYLLAVEPRFGPPLAACGMPPPRRRSDGFGALMDAIVGQQVSTAAARAIRGRLVAAGLDTPATISASTDEDLRACGLSRQKVRYLRALAGADIDYAALRAAPDAAVMATLLPLPGIGRWTVEMYLIFALGRADVFAPDDLALAEAARLAFDLPDRPRPKALAAMAAAWSPWRAVAARTLWDYYAHISQVRR